jgi:hypothetical protein
VAPSYVVLSLTMLPCLVAARSMSREQIVGRTTSARNNPFTPQWEYVRVRNRSPGRLLSRVHPPPTQWAVTGSLGAQQHFARLLGSQPSHPASCNRQQITIRRAAATVSRRATTCCAKQTSDLGRAKALKGCQRRAIAFPRRLESVCSRDTGCNSHHPRRRSFYVSEPTCGRNKALWPGPYCSRMRR